MTLPAIPAIYIRLPNWIGDVCMSLPSLELVLESGKPVVVAARPWARALLDAYPLLDFVEMQGTVRNDRARIATHRKSLGLDKAVGLLLPDSLSSALVFRLAGLACAGYRDDGRSLLLHWPIHKPGTALHAVESWFYLTHQALQAWQLPPSVEQPLKNLNLKISRQYEEEGQAAMQAARLRPGQFILIAPTATGTHKGKNKVWPHFEALTKALQNRGLTVVMCPPPSEREQARQNAPTAQCLAPLSLPAFTSLAREAKVVICNDSGVSHLAAAVGARQITLFGVTERERTGPWSANAICLGSSQQWPNLEQVLERVLTLAP